MRIQLCEALTFYSNRSPIKASRGRNFFDDKPRGSRGAIDYSLYLSNEKFLMGGQGWGLSQLNGPQDVKSDRPPRFALGEFMAHQSHFQ